MSGEKGALYGIGVGPGDPELLTVKAVRLLQAADVIAAPDSGGESRTALNIVKGYIVGKPVLLCPTPMTRDRETLGRVWEDNAEQICALLEQGKQVAFITLGDPTVYSTYFYLHRRVLARGYGVEIVPGVPSFCAAAAKLGVPLCEGDQRLLVVPASYGDLTDSLDVDANKVLMKAGRQLGTLKETLQQRGELENASLVVNCGLPGEQIWPSFAQAEGNAGYFSLVLLRQGEQTEHRKAGETE
ncbi:MAG: precorrin-2 C(20)-methyltransferase [Oscillospiraceae bacterium]|nr:precorrin-2 C(20)-methyltransferase [Oscillospiraceae bacterium]